MGTLRLLLALAVVFAHAGPLLGWRWLTMTGGPLAVQMFYVVSGFYMALVLNEKYVGRGAYSAFAKSRLIRLFPMYLAVVAVTLVIGWGLHFGGWTIAPLQRWLEHSSGMPWSHAFALGIVQLSLVGQDIVLFTAVDPVRDGVFWTANFHEEALPSWQFMLVPQAWTISLELMFYAIAPLLVRRHIVVIAVMLGASLALRVFLMRGLHLYSDPWTYRFFPTELALFLAGALSYRLYRRLREGTLLHPLLGWGALIGAVAAVLGYHFLPDVLRRAPYGLAVILFALPFALPFIFHLTARWRFDRALGELSYPIYLVHYLFCFVLVAVGVPMWSQYSAFVVVPATLLTAWLLWRFVGQPFEIGRQRIGARLAAELASERGVRPGEATVRGAEGQAPVVALSDTGVGRRRVERRIVSATERNDKSSA